MAGRWGRSQPAHTIRPHMPLLPHSLVYPGTQVEGAPTTTAVATEPNNTAVAVEPTTIAEEMHNQ